MEQIRQQPTTKIWPLLVLTGLALWVAFVLNEAQARELPMPSPIHPLNTHRTHPANMESKAHSVEKIALPNRQNSPITVRQV